MAVMTAPPLVTDEHVVVPATIVDPVVVSFDGQYVWSFLPHRDGSRSRNGWRVQWPAVMRDLARRHHLRPAQRPRRGDTCTSRPRSRSAATPRRSPSAMPTDTRSRWTRPAT